MKIPFLPSCDARTLELNGALFNVSNVNWPADFPYAPICAGKIARTPDAIWVQWHVSGLGITVRSLEDDGRIWEDSCCELFLQDPRTEVYYNVEVNAAGHLLVGMGKGREGRVHLPEAMSKIIRFGGVAAPVDIADKHLDWSIGLVIPYEAVGLDPQNLPDHLKGNFYKCGDKTAHPHFLSWAPIGTPAPDFHFPQYFGEIQL